MKKIITILLSFVLTLSFFGCERENPNNALTSYNFVMPDGAPTLSVVSLMKNYSKINGIDINYKIVPANTIGAEISKQENDIALMPTNASAKLYNKGTKLKLATVNVFGVLYMVGRQSINTLNDLVGKVVYNIGLGGTPDLMLKYFLTNANIEYVESAQAVSGKVALAYESEASNVVAKLAGNIADYGVLGQPVVNNAIKKANVSVVLDFQQEWQRCTGIQGYTQAGVVVKESVYNDKAFMNALYSALQQNYEFISNNPQEIKGILANYQSTLTFDFNTQVVQACNINCKKAYDIKQEIETYFNNIATFDNTFIGGSLPNNDYYYNFD